MNHRTFAHKATLSFIRAFKFFQEELMAGEETATCPSCSLIVKVIYDPVSLICPNYLLKNSQNMFFSRTCSELKRRK